MKSVSVIIPNFNGKNLLEKYLPFLYKALHFSKIDFEIIIPDDASTDNSFHFIKDRYPEIQFIKSEVNAGFGGNCNRGIAAAKNDLIFLLNNDVKLTENYFEFLLPYFEDDSVFGVMGALTTESNGEIQDGAKYPEWKNHQLNFTLNYIFEEPQPALSLFLSGANALVDRKKIQMIGGFDEIFNPFYFEDSELGIRTWRLGWKNYFEPRAICYHEISSTIKKFNQRKKIKIISRRNKWILHSIHLEKSQKNKWMLYLKINLFYRWMTGDFEFYTSWKQFKKKHSEIEKSILKMEKLFTQTESLKSVNEVSEQIKNSIGKRKIKLF